MEPYSKWLSSLSTMPLRSIQGCYVYQESVPFLLLSSIPRCLISFLPSAPACQEVWQWDILPYSAREALAAASLVRDPRKQLCLLRAGHDCLTLQHGGMSHDVSPTMQCWWWITEVHCSHLGSPGSFSSAVRSFYDWLTFPNISLMVLGKASHTHSVYISLGISLICRFWLSGAGSGLRVSILNKHPGGADASGPGTTLWVAKV